MKYFKIFLKEWGISFLIIALVGLSRLFLWSNVRVEGHSMDPTLADGEILFVVKHLPIDRFDIVVAHEEDGNKDIVKQVTPSVMRTTSFISMVKKLMSLIWQNTSNVSMRISYKVLMPEQDGRVLKVNILEILLKKHQHLLSM